MAESKQFNELYSSEAIKGEKAAYYLRWLIVALLFGGAVIMVANGRFVQALPFTFLLISIAFLYNILLTYFFKTERMDLSWVKYVSVTLDISLVTINQFISSLYANTFAVATFATILLYPVFLLYAALRHSRSLIIYATLYTLLVFNLSYFIIYPMMAAEILETIPSADILGQIYKSFYIGLFGFSLLFVPRTIKTLIHKQAALVEDKMHKELEIKLHEQRENQLIQNLYQYVSKEVAEKLLEDPELLEGKSVYLTALFVDIRGFTAFCSNRNADEILRMLNQFYSIVAEAVKHHEGLVNKYLGDSVFAIFGAPDPYEQTEEKAVRACLEILDVFKSQREKFYREFGVDLQIGIGIESGSVMVGNVGNTERIEYTALGDAVNMASRYESLNKRFNTRILFSRHVKESIEKSFQDLEFVDLGEHQVRGAEGLHRFYTIKGLGFLPDS